MVAVPIFTPCTSPDPSTVAFTLALLHVPPAVTSLKVVAAPWHTDGVPKMAEGAEFTDTTEVE